jgi:membrane-associated phospholipid phosphatase
MKKVCCLATILLIFSSFDANVYSQNRDIDLLRKINLDRNKSLDGTYTFITNTAGPVSFGTPVLMCGIGLFKHDSILIRNSIYIGSSVVISAILTTVLKYAVNRPRPFVTYPDIEKVGKGGSPSFPSGHTSEVFALATSVSLSYPKWYVIAPSFAWAGAVGYSRMDLGVHYPSDVIAGAILGAGCAWVTFMVNKKLNSHR